MPEWRLVRLSCDQNSRWACISEILWIWSGFAPGIVAHHQVLSTLARGIISSIPRFRGCELWWWGILTFLECLIACEALVALWLFLLCRSFSNSIIYFLLVQRTFCGPKEKYDKNLEKFRSRGICLFSRLKLNSAVDQPTRCRLIGMLRLLETVGVYGPAIWLLSPYLFPVLPGNWYPSCQDRGCVSFFTLLGWRLASKTFVVLPSNHSSYKDWGISSAVILLDIGGPKSSRPSAISLNQ
jgi:hypothetical protein